MATVNEILRNAGMSDYEINSLDGRTTQAFGQVLSEAESQRATVQEFWANTYAPSVDAWEQEKSDLGRKLASAEAQRAALERERQVLAEQGLISRDNFTQSRNDGGQFVSQTPGTPTFSGDPNEFVSRVSRGLSQLSDVEWKYRKLYNQPLPESPSSLIAEADRLGISPMEAADRKYKFSAKEQELRDSTIRQEVETRIRKEFAEKSGSNPDMRLPSGNSTYAETRRAIETGKLKDPTRMTPQERRQQALNSIHKSLEEREQRDV